MYRIGTIRSKAPKSAIARICDENHLGNVQRLDAVTVEKVQQTFSDAARYSLLPVERRVSVVFGHDELT